jgi:hypothetical protein
MDLRRQRERSRKIRIVIQELLKIAFKNLKLCAASGCGDVSLRNTEYVPRPLILTAADMLRRDEKTYFTSLEFLFANSCARQTSASDVMGRHGMKSDFCVQSGAAGADVVASCKTSARGETLSTTPHQLHSKLGKTEPRLSFGTVRLKCIGKPQNGQWGCGESVSMPRGWAYMVNEK